MISLFRKNLFINSLLLLPYIILLRLKSLFFEQAYIANESESILTRSIFSLFKTNTSQALCCIMIIYLNALLINRLVVKNHISKESSLVSGLIYGLLASILLPFLKLSPVLLASPFLILSVQAIFSSYNNMKSANEIFLSGFYMSIASLFYFPFIYFLIFTFVGFIIMRSFSFKERMQHLIGWATPFLLTVSVEYYLQFYPTCIPTYFFNKFGLTFLKGMSLSQFLSIGFFSFLILLCLFSFNTYMGKKIIAGQKKISILYWLMLFSGITALIFSGLSLDHLHILCIPISIFFAINLVEMKNPLWPEIIHLSLILLLVILHLDLINLS